MDASGLSSSSSPPPPPQHHPHHLIGTSTPPASQQLRDKIFSPSSLRPSPSISSYGSARATKRPRLNQKSRSAPGQQINFGKNLKKASSSSAILEADPPNVTRNFQFHHCHHPLDTAQIITGTSIGNTTTNPNHHHQINGHNYSSLSLFQPIAPSPFTVAPSYTLPFRNEITKFPSSHLPNNTKTKLPTSTPSKSGSTSRKVCPPPLKGPTMKQQQHQQQHQPLKSTDYYTTSSSAVPWATLTAPTTFNSTFPPSTGLPTTALSSGKPTTGSPSKGYRSHGYSYSYGNAPTIAGNGHHAQQASMGTTITTTATHTNTTVGITPSATVSSPTSTFPLDEPLSAPSLAVETETETAGVRSAPRPRETPTRFRSQSDLHASALRAASRRQLDLSKSSELSSPKASSNHCFAVSNVGHNGRIYLQPTARPTAIPTASVLGSPQAWPRQYSEENQGGRPLTPQFQPLESPMPSPISGRSISPPSLPIQQHILRKVRTASPATLTREQNDGASVDSQGHEHLREATFNYNITNFDLEDVAASTTSTTPPSFLDYHFDFDVGETAPQLDISFPSWRIGTPSFDVFGHTLFRTPSHSSITTTMEPVDCTTNVDQNDVHERERTKAEINRKKRKSEAFSAEDTAFLREEVEHDITKVNEVSQPTEDSVPKQQGKEVASSIQEQFSASSPTSTHKPSEIKISHSTNEEDRPLETLAVPASRSPPSTSSLHKNQSPSTPTHAPSTSLPSKPLPSNDSPQSQGSIRSRPTIIIPTSPLPKTNSSVLQPPTSISISQAPSLSLPITQEDPALQATDALSSSWLQVPGSRSPSPTRPTQKQPLTPTTTDRVTSQGSSSLLKKSSNRDMSGSFYFGHSDSDNRAKYMSPTNTKRPYAAHSPIPSASTPRSPIYDLSLFMPSFVPDAQTPSIASNFSSHFLPSSTKAVVSGSASSPLSITIPLPYDSHCDILSPISTIPEGLSRPERSTFMPSSVVIYHSMFDTLTFKPHCDDPAIVRYSPTGAVTAATPPRLVAEITSHTFLDYDLLSDFFLTYRSFVEPTNLLKLLFARFLWADKRGDQIGIVTRVRTFVALRHWVLNYFYDDFVPDYDLRILFCDQLNNLTPEIMDGSAVTAANKKIPLKILSELKRCWRRMCSQYWDLDDEERPGVDLEPIFPGNEFPQDFSYADYEEDEEEEEEEIEDDTEENYHGTRGNGRIPVRCRSIQLAYNLRETSQLGCSIPGVTGAPEAVVFGNPRGTPPPNQPIMEYRAREDRASPPQSLTSSLDITSCSFPTSSVAANYVRRHQHQHSISNSGASSGGANTTASMAFNPLAAHPVSPSHLASSASENQISTLPRNIIGKRIRVVPREDAEDTHHVDEQGRDEHVHSEASTTLVQSTSGYSQGQRGRGVTAALPAGFAPPPLPSTTPMMPMPGALVRGNVLPPGHAIVDILSGRSDSQRQTTVLNRLTLVEQQHRQYQEEDLKKKKKKKGKHHTGKEGLEDYAENDGDDARSAEMKRQRSRHYHREPLSVMSSRGLRKLIRHVRKALQGSSCPHESKLGMTSSSLRLHMNLHTSGSNSSGVSQELPDSKNKTPKLAPLDAMSSRTLGVSTSRKVARHLVPVTAVVPAVPRMRLNSGATTLNGKPPVRIDLLAAEIAEEFHRMIQEEEREEGYGSDGEGHVEDGEEHDSMSMRAIREQIANEEKDLWSSNEQDALAPSPQGTTGLLATSFSTPILLRKATTSVSPPTRQSEHDSTLEPTYTQGSSSMLRSSQQLIDDQHHLQYTSSQLYVDTRSSGHDTSGSTQEYAKDAATALRKRSQNTVPPGADPTPPTTPSYTGSGRSSMGPAPIGIDSELIPGRASRTIQHASSALPLGCSHQQMSDEKHSSYPINPTIQDQFRLGSSGTHASSVQSVLYQRYSSQKEAALKEQGLAANGMGPVSDQQHERLCSGQEYQHLEPAPLRVVRRRPGGDLRAATTINDLEGPETLRRSLSTGSVTTYRRAGPESPPPVEERTWIEETGEQPNLTYVQSRIGGDSGVSGNMMMNQANKGMLGKTESEEVLEKSIHESISVMSTHSSQMLPEWMLDDARRLATSGEQSLPTAEEEKTRGVEAALCKLEGEYGTRVLDLVSPITPAQGEGEGEYGYGSGRERGHGNAYGYGSFEGTLSYASATLESPPGYHGDGVISPLTALPTQPGAFVFQADASAGSSAPLPRSPVDSTRQQVPSRPKAPLLREEDERREEEALAIPRSALRLTLDLNFTQGNKVNKMKAQGTPTSVAPSHRSQPISASHIDSTRTSFPHVRESVPSRASTGTVIPAVLQGNRGTMETEKQLPPLPTPASTPKMSSDEGRSSSRYSTESNRGTHSRRGETPKQEPPREEPTYVPPKYAVHLPFILAFDSETLAQQFTLIEKDALEEVDWRELIDMTWKNAHVNTRSWVDFLRHSEARGIEVVIARFNIMVKWVISEIVLTQDVEERARCIVKFIHIAQHCREYRNFATVAQITFALSSQEIGRLSKTWALIPASDKKTFAELEVLVTPVRNFHSLRTEMEKGGLTTGCIPFVGISTHDLLFNAQRPSDIAATTVAAADASAEAMQENMGSLVNFERCRCAASIVKSLLRLIEASTLYEFTTQKGVTERCLWVSALSDENIRARARALE